MTTTNKRTKSKHHVPALLTAFGITVLLAVVMFGFGLNALFNQNLLIAQAATVQQVDLSTATPEEIQALISTYQVREAQYQQELTKAANQLNQANTQVATYQSLVQQLRTAGVIRIDSSGQVIVQTGRNVEHEGPFDHD